MANTQKLTNVRKLIQERSDDFLAEVIGDFVCDKRLNDGTCADKCPFVDSENCEAEFKDWLKQEEAEGQH